MLNYPSWRQTCVFYTKATSNLLVMWIYSPPKNGGQCDMINMYISSDCLNDLFETFFISVLWAWVDASLIWWACSSNKTLEAQAACLKQGKRVYKESLHEEAMYWCLCFINDRYSMIAYPVGMHCNHFWHMKGSLKDKSFFCLTPNICSEVQRGGFLVGNSCVYWLLDCWLVVGTINIHMLFQKTPKTYLLFNHLFVVLH